MAKPDKYTKSARGQECQVRIPGVCNRNPETVVFAHLNGGGIGMKRASIHGAYACSACHDVIDGRAKLPKSHWDWLPEHEHRRAVIKAHLEGVIRTQEIMIKEGILEL